MTRRNLTVITDAHVTRIVIERGRAVGVAYRFGKDERIVRAGREVILSARALQSPQILMLSGIGPADHLTSLGIPVVLDRAEVGSNLQDHLDYTMIFRSPTPTCSAWDHGNTRHPARGKRMAHRAHGPPAVHLRESEHS